VTAKNAILPHFFSFRIRFRASREAIRATRHRFVATFETLRNFFAKLHVSTNGVIVATSSHTNLYAEITMLHPRVGIAKRSATTIRRGLRDDLVAGENQGYFHTGGKKEGAARNSPETAQKYQARLPITII
jgi:hypothetical protein